MAMRLSYSTFKDVLSGNMDRAVASYFRIGTFPLKPELIKALALGNHYDRLWEEEVMATGKLPSVFGTKQLTKPQTQHKLIKKLRDDLYISGVPDVIDEAIMYDFKTGTTGLSHYLNKPLQAFFYWVLQPYKEFWYLHHDILTGISNAGVIMTRPPTSFVASILTAADKLREELVARGLPVDR